MKRCGVWLVALGVLAWGLPLGMAWGQPEGPPPGAPGRVLTGFLYGEPGSLDFQAGHGLAALQATVGIYSRLVRPPREGSEGFLPDLATRWNESANGREVAFDLRGGVKWHDGESFTAADVTASFARVLQPKFGSSRCGGLLRPLVRDVKAEGSHRAIFRLQMAAPELFPALASPWCAIGAAHVLQRDGSLARVAVGTGPFRLKAYHPGIEMLWERNPNYYDSRLPVLDGVRQLVLPGRSRQIAAAEAGKIDLWGGWPPLPPARLAELGRTLGRQGGAAPGEVVTRPLNAAWTVVFNTSKPPFDQPSLRRAVSLALNRQQLFQQAFGGTGTPCALLDPAIYGAFALPAEVLSALPGCRQPKEQDLAEARRLVAALHPRGVEVEIAVRLVGDYPRRTQLVVAALEKINIKSTVKAYGSAEGYRVLRAGRFDLIAAQDAILPVADPGAVFQWLFERNSLRNWGHWEDRKFSALLLEARTSRKTPDRISAYHRVQQYLLTEDSGAVILGWLQGGFYRSGRVVNHHPGLTVFDWFDLEAVGLHP